MRAVQLAQVAARAESLRLREFASRSAVRAALGAAAVVFLVGFVIGAHVAIALALVSSVGPVWATCIVAGADLVIAVVLGVFAAMKGPGKVEQQALEVRQTAMSQMSESLTFSAIVMPIARRAVGRRLVDRMFGVVAGRLVGRRR